VRRAEERALRAAAALGVDRRHSGAAFAVRAGGLARAATALDRSLGAGCVALVTGPSGAGKTTLLRLLPCPGVAARPLRPRQRPMAVAGLCGRLSLGRWLRLLSRFGLAEARVLLARAGELSAGESARLELALAAAACERRTGAARTLVVDEWCSTLDGETAAGVAAGAARWARETGARVIGATARGELASWFAPQVLVRIDEQGGVEWTVGGLSRAG